MIMRAILNSGVVEFPGDCLLVVLDDAERARHAQMHQQDVSGGKVRQKVFSAATEAGHRLSRQACGKIPLERKAQVFAPDFHLGDPPSLHDRLQAAADGLDFG